MEKINWSEFGKIISIKDDTYLNIVYLHAFTGSVKNKINMINKFLNCNFYGFDMPGHGETKIKKPEDVDLNYYAELAIQFILDYDIKDIILMGHSMGGGLAMIISTDNRIANRIKKIVLEAPANPACLINENIISSLIPSTIEDMYFITNQLFYDPISFFGNENRLNKFIEFEFDRLQKQQFLKKLLKLDVQKEFEQKIETQIKNNTIPTLVILGESDEITPYWQSFNIFKKNIKFTIKSVPKAKHVPLAEQPLKCLDCINRFISIY